MKTPPLLIIALSDLRNDPRVFRQIKALRDSHDVCTIGLAPSGLPGVSFFPISPEKGFWRRFRSHFLTKLLRKDYESYYSRTYGIRAVTAAVGALQFDLIIANDLDALPLACQLKGAQSRVLFDAHEYSVEQHSDRLLWRLLYRDYNYYLFSTRMKCIDRMITATPGLANEYEERFFLKSEVILNAPKYTNIAPSPGESSRLRLIHHGRAGPSRSLELMVRAMRWIRPGVELNLMLVPGNHARYVARLSRMAAHDPRIHFLQPVPMQSIVERIHEFDVGICLLPPTNLNLKHALPNKFFEYIQARLALVVGPSATMADVVRDNGIGIVTEDFSARALARAVNSLTPQSVRAFKERSHVAARELCSECEMQKLNRIVREMLR